MKITMSFYRVYFHPPRDTAERQYIDQLTGSEPSAAITLQNFFASLPVFEERGNLNAGERMGVIYHDTAKQVTTEEQISGILQVGEDGFASEIHDGQSGMHLLSRTPEHIEFMPFYYLIDASAGKKDLIVGVQHFGSHGISSKFLPLMIAYLRASYPDYTVKHDTIHLGPIFFGNIIANGEVREIEAVSFKQITDRASTNEEKIKVSRAYGAVKRGGFLPRPLTDLIRTRSTAIMSAADGQELSQDLVTEVKELLSINIPEDETITELSATIVCNGSSRKIDLGNIYKFATRYDMNHVERGEDRHPEFASIDEESKRILENDIRPLIRG